MYLSLLSSMLLCLQCVNYVHAQSPGCRYALPWAMYFCAYGATITDLNTELGCPILAYQFGHPNK